MKKLNKALIVGLSAVALLTTSCGEEYLDTIPTSSVGTATALGSTENAMKALNGIAAAMASQQYMGSQGMCGETYVISKMENYPSPDYHYNYYASGWAPLINQEWNYRNNSAYIYYGWYYYYMIIGQANTIISNIDNATGTQEERNFIKASALTYRAYAYEKLMHYYVVRYEDSNSGTCDALPLRIDESTGDLGYSSYKDVYAQIYKDCEDAIALFNASGMNRASGEVWIANKNVADAVYARAALQSHDWATAATHARAAMAGYPLMSNDAYAAGFSKPTSEWIFGCFGGSEENQWYWAIGAQYACNGYYSANQPTGAGAISVDLMRRIPDNDARKACFITEDKFPEFNWNDVAKLAYYRAYGILGLANSEAEATLADPLWDAVAAYVASRTPGGLAPAYQAGYFYIGGQLKLWCNDLPGVGYFPFIRSSEMLLIIAEAEYRNNNAAGAQAALVELNATSGRNPEYTCTKTGNDLFEEIVDYRALELWGEGFEWSDYKRWNRTMTRIGLTAGGSAHAASTVTVKPDEANQWTFAIPEKETDYNAALKNGIEDGPEVK